MTFTSQTLPLPPQARAPVTMTAGTWLDLPADARETIFQTNITDGSLFEVVGLTGTPAADVALELTSRLTTGRGQQTTRESVNTAATGGYDQPVPGPVATDSVTLDARNRSATDLTTAGAGVFRTAITYAVRPPTVREKLARGIPLTQRDQELRQSFGLGEYDDLNVTPRVDAPATRPTVDGKSVLRERSYTESVSIDASSTGAPGVTVLDESIPSDRVLYLTGLRVNGTAFDPTDDVRVVIEQSGPQTVAETEAFGLPATPTAADLHLPFLESADVRVRAANPVDGVTVRLDTVEVDRTLTEKALYGLEQQVQANDGRAGERKAVYDTLRAYIRAGIPIRPNLGAILDEAADRAGSSVDVGTTGVI